MGECDACRHFLFILLEIILDARNDEICPLREFGSVSGAEILRSAQDDRRRVLQSACRFSTPERNHHGKVLITPSQTRSEICER